MNLYQNRIAVKVGTSTLTNTIVESNFNPLISGIQNMGHESILVSSGVAV